MVKRELVWEVSQDGMSIVPATPQDGGVQGDHNVTRAIFKVAEGSAWADPANAVYIECVDGAGNVDTTEQLSVVDDTVSYLLPRAWTQYGGVTTLRLVAEGPGVEGVQAYSPYASVRFESRQNAMHKVDGLLKGRMAEMEKRANDALSGAEEAERMAAQAATAAQNAATSAMKQAAQSATAATAAENARAAAENARAAAAQEANQAAKQRTQAEQAATFAGNARDEAVATLEEVKKEIAAGGGNGNTEGNAAYNRINVRDYGAVGDGVTNDQPAIWAAITAAKELIAQDIPCEIYFPAGTYGFLEGGMGIALPQGKGGLRITGAGRETTILKYLDNWTPSSKYGGSVWYALDVWASGGKTGNPDTYIHDVNITGLTVYDPNPCAHNRHPDKGDSEKEENHGIDLSYCLRASVTDCQFISVGDEAIDIYSCTDVVVMNNHCVDSPGAGTGGGAISICDGCVGVVVSNNTVNGSALDETLDDGTVIQKTNFGIAVESLYTPVRDVVIANNVVCNIQGNGINLAATNDGAGIYDVRIDSNVLRDCTNAVATSGQLPKEWVSVSNNTISHSGSGVFFNTIGTANATISGNTIRNTDRVGIYVYGDGNIVDGNKLENIGTVAVFIQGSAIVRDCIINNTGVVSPTGNGAIHGFDPSGAENPTYSVYGCRLTGVRQAIGINNATVVENTTIEMVDADGNPVTSEQPLGNCYYLKRLVNCQMDGYIKVRNANAIVQGVTVTCTQAYQPAFSVSANGVIITDCQIKYTGYKNAITEASGKDGNLFVNNITNSAITTVGANTVAKNIVNGKWVDNTVTECSHQYDNACDPVCNLCGAVRSVTHSYEAVVTAPDCVNGGYTTYTCACGDTYVDNYTAALGHNYVDGICDTCGSADPNYDPPCKHEYDHDCDTVCNLCGAVRTVEHSYGEGVVTKEADYGVDGEMTYTCTVCGATKTEAISALDITAEYSPQTPYNYTVNFVHGDDDADVIRNFLTVKDGDGNIITDYTLSNTEDGNILVSYHGAEETVTVHRDTMTLEADDDQNFWHGSSSRSASSTPPYVAASDFRRHIYRYFIPVKAGYEYTFDATLATNSTAPWLEVGVEWYNANVLEAVANGNNYLAADATKTVYVKEDIGYNPWHAVPYVLTPPETINGKPPVAVRVVVHRSDNLDNIGLTSSAKEVIITARPVNT